MDIADLAAKAALKFTSSNGRKLQKKMSTPAIPKADPVYIKNDKNDGFSCGYAMAEVMPADITAKKYDNVCMDCLSMGMSEDYADAIACGSTMIRVGTAIFGARIYK